ncbi:hypothetical protein GCM10010503_36760 [Streptomyces lucensis JCM 4490]|uniref:Uncharacterized protein n=1 Tax=Streptomyces lucensis JCM 4490 TaxID=1306176 RepID=A0A918J7B3_9ACTN|nr:hypothetical protein GCM10010503_36760 [Streptomyces lucensis JCM 4490]
MAVKQADVGTVEQTCDALYLGQTTAKRQVVREGPDETAQALARGGNPAGSQVCIDSGKGAAASVPMSGWVVSTSCT